MSNAFARSAFPASSLRSPRPRVTARRRSPPGRAIILPSMSADSGDLRRPSSGAIATSARSSRSLNIGWTNGSARSPHARTRPPAAAARTSGDESWSSGCSRYSAGRPPPGFANTVAAAARTAGSLSSIDSRTSLPGTLPVVAPSVASDRARRRPGVAR